MPELSSLTPEQREQAITLFEQGHGQRAVAYRLGVRYQAVRNLHGRWRVHGRLTLVPSNTKRVYPVELKLEAVTRHAAGEASTDLAVELGISTPRLIQRWSELYRTGGVKALEPRKRGRRASSEQQPTDQTEYLRQENERLRAEVAYLKKLRALRHQGHR
ncbi:helix-turn-helix domain-containing protein [Kocuria soli]|uniref:Helix-turn-helix domain-containing protein n=1 Tax=Kocuria soli TaxID=2485125 RepID=A0A3N3ZM86_9MICC|nr:helix-turn-helix domain-containing protein [Kocuria soli]ROZ61761.1 helix-turn-helix domain-containing protein [Kocuria soli]